MYCVREVTENLYWIGGNDHRTVMSSAVLACCCRGDSKITGAEAMKKSYPGFVEDMKKLKGAVDVEI